MRNYLRILMMTVACVLLASCDLLRDNKLLITSHIQTVQMEHPSEIMTLPIGGEAMTFRKVPEFSQRSISAFEPFAAEDGQTYGVLLQLDTKGKNALELASRMNTGMSMLTMIDAVPVDMVQIDRPISDGRFTIWRGLAKKEAGDLSGAKADWQQALQLAPDYGWAKKLLQGV